MVKPNIGIINAIVRITFGFTLFAWALSKMMRRSSRTEPMPLFTVAMASMKIAEGITRFCPLTYLFEENMRHEHHDHYEIEDDFEISPVNPS
ncbi:DUF2892 domain-containing protein [Bacillus shivajii]|uniref:YgaP family membrane protein n=1 Tax=Bacillus shivajii TaxID=1983719 RepID=UPI001CFB919B|nr:DUF2892 domain-containing protein [Bacillus shivajii]UCZ53796.1 DUF2892 domain-containing protein [Bacillus shivajii]